jgi:alpha-mannosidase/mannosylglycerate hydrolase
VENTATDHRLRLLLPSGAKADTCLADSAFDVVERPIALREDNYLYRELEVETRPQQSWTAVFDAGRGLAVCAAGLLECATPDLPERPLALTLFRGTRKTVGTAGEPEGQQSGNLIFHYCILPLQGPPERRRLCELGALLNSGLRTAQLGQIDQQIMLADLQSLESDLPALPAQASFLAIHGLAVLTSMRQVGEALEVRLFNPTSTQGTVILDFSGWPEGMSPPEWMQAVDFESNPLGEVMAVGQIELKPKQIMTIKCW